MEQVKIENAISSLIDIIQDIIVQQATREISGTEWAEELLDKLLRIQNDLL